MASSRRPSLSAFVCAVAAVSFCLPLSAAAAAEVQRAGTASIESDEAARTWTIGSDGARLVLGLDPRRDFEIVRATSPSDRPWITGGQTIVLSAIQWNEAQDEVTVRPQGLRRRSTCTVRSVDVGQLGTATGAELMADGVTVVQSPNSAAHIIVIQRQ
jgi:hypothetical protein